MVPVTLAAGRHDGVARRCDGPPRPASVAAATRLRSQVGAGAGVGHGGRRDGHERRLRERRRWHRRGSGTGAGSAGAGPAALTFQSVGCERWSDVPGNAAVDPGLDDTDGHYVEWGPPVDGPVAAYASGTLPAGCSFIDGVAVRISAVPLGEVFAPGSPRYTPLGQRTGSSRAWWSHGGERGELIVATLALSVAARSLVSGADGAGLVASSLTVPGQRSPTSVAIGTR